MHRRCLLEVGTRNTIVMSRKDILAAIQKNKPERTLLPLNAGHSSSVKEDLKGKFSGMLNQIGGRAITVESYDEINTYVRAHYNAANRLVTLMQELSAFFEPTDEIKAPHEFADAELAILKGHFGVAENAAVWITGDQMGQRVVPFICQHLAIVLAEANIVEDMHQAYERINDQAYDFGVFIAGPSKTADIEQSLVIGAHGARSLVVFLMKS